MDAQFVRNDAAIAIADFLGRPQQLFIDNKWMDARSGETIEIFNPATARVLSTVAAGGASDIDAAVTAARKAFESGPWAKMRAAERARLIHRLADVTEARSDEIVLLESLDGGNPLGSVRAVDFTRAVESLRYHAGWCTKLAGETPMSAPDMPGFSYTLREPLGVAGLITPWNAPFLMAVNKLATALSAGCTCVLKPAELAPLSAIRLGELVQEAGFPDGVVNIVTGFGPAAGQALVDHPGVNKISFTGSTLVGKSILRGAASGMKRVILELGGKSPVIVFADADLQRAGAAVANEIIFKTGQFCAAGTRLFVHKNAFDIVVNDIADRLRKVKVGPGTMPDVEMGPIISQKQLDRVMHYMAAGSDQGGEILAGGRRIESEGYFVQPTLMVNTKPGMSVVEDEIFGPVLCAMPFGDEDELGGLAAMANDTCYGLAAKLWTRSLGTAHRMVGKLHAGSIVVNGGGGEGPLPFGGYKQSGLGRENGREGVLSYTELKSVSIGF
ncbi:MAG: aldehyde dehydrogenase family protein [Rhizomicrobium sp.]